MVLKVRAFDNNEEILIPIGQILGSVKIGRIIFDTATIVAGTITLADTPISLSELVVLNGMVLTEGAAYDYTITGNSISFNANVLTQTGHVLVSYNYN